MKNKQNLKEKTRAELLLLATKLSITGRHAMTKDALRTSIKKSLKTQAAPAIRTSTKTKPKKPAAKKRQKPADKKPAGKKAVARQQKTLQKYIKSPVPETVKQAKPELPQPLHSREMPPAQELPSTYGETQITVMVRDPYWAYAYWEIEPSRISAIKTRLGKGFKQAQMILRVYDITDIEFDGTNALRFADIEITSAADSWYINLGAAYRTYCVDIGIKSMRGDFYCLARSHSVTTPSDTVSEMLDEQWGTAREEFEKISALSGAGVMELHEQVSSPGLFSMTSETFSRQK